MLTHAIFCLLLLPPNSLLQVGRNLTGLKEGLVELKEEANRNRDIVNEGIKVGRFGVVNKLNIPSFCR